MKYSFQERVFPVIMYFIALTGLSTAQDSVPQYHIFELSFTGTNHTLNDNPLRDIELRTIWRHETGEPLYHIYGFWDGDGNDGSYGDIYKVRFYPTRTGMWELVEVISNDPELLDQNVGLEIECIPSGHPGFWIVDRESANGHWYKRSDGSHPYFIGNTFYSFVSEYFIDGPNGSNIEKDIRECGKYYNKIRFAITGDIYPHPVEEPFLDNLGNPTDNGDFSHRPNPSWFNKQVDLAVKTANEMGMIADIILNGHDSENARSALRAGENGSDPLPFLKYISARYGSYPNVWFCLSNEYDIRKPKFNAEEIKVIGNKLKSFLAYPAPISVHPSQRDWDPSLNDMYNWNDHIIIQNKIKTIHLATDKIELNYYRGMANLLSMMSWHMRGKETAGQNLMCCKPCLEHSWEADMVLQDKNQGKS